MPRLLQSARRRHKLLIGSLLLLLTVLIAGCGGANSSSGSAVGTTNSAAIPPSNHTSNGSGGSASAGKSSSGSVVIVQQYLIKTLKVSMDVKDTTKAADDLQAWVSNTDPRATSAGIDYEQAGNNLYTISLSFSVQATLYPQIERYLRDYAPQHDGHLLGFAESVQDVTNDYIDTQSRLTNLRAEQTRLLDLLSHAQALGDIISIQDKLTDVEGQIENIEAHLKNLNDQVTFYTISIQLQPTVITNPEPPTTVWNLGQIFHDAFASSLVFAQGLLTFFVWLLAYSFYIIPIALLAWYLWRRFGRQRPTTAPSPTPSTPVAPPSVSA